MTVSILKKLISYLRFYKLDLIIVMLSILSVSISLLIMGWLFRQLVDNGLKNNNLGSINISILSLCILIFIFSISSFLRSYYISKIAEKIIGKIRQETYASLITSNISYFEELKIGDIISRFTTDLELISKLIITFLSFFIRNSIMLVGAIILMFYQSYKLASIVVITIPFLVLPLVKLGKYVKGLSKNALKTQSTIISNIEESFVNIKTIHSFNKQINKITNFNQQIALYIEQTGKRLKVRSLFFALAIAMILSSITIIIWVGATDIIKGNLSSGQMISFIYYAIVAALSSGGIFELFSEVHLPLVAAERVFEMAQCHTHESGYPQLKMHKVQTGILDSRLRKNDVLIEFQNIHFAYPSRPDLLVLNNSSFKIEYGKFVGICGKSGTGKSTIMQLLMKFYRPTTGIIKIAGQDIWITDTQKLRSIIAYVPQEPSIFSGTIKENIAFSKPDASENEILNAAELSGIMDFVKNFQFGLDTEIGERGVKLSGGQKQRIAISRAILYNPQILFLDEATSSLDNESEQKLLQSLQQLMKGKTIISIAHRISSIEQADEILVINQGHISAKGSHSKLLEDSSLYRAICLEQG